MNDKLSGVHPNLVKVVNKAKELSLVEFTITQGLRTAEEQNRLYQQGRTKPGAIVTKVDGYKKKSNHQAKADGKGHAIDFAVLNNGKINWNDIEGYKEVARAFFQAACFLGIKIRWGADWDMDGKTADETFLDWGHIELIEVK